MLTGAGNSPPAPILFCCLFSLKTDTILLAGWSRPPVSNLSRGPARSSRPKWRWRHLSCAPVVSAPAFIRMPKVYTYYYGLDESPRADQARFIKVWRESWLRAGWTPRLWTARTRPGCPQCFRWLRSLNGVFVPWDAINIGLRRRPESWDSAVGETIITCDTPEQAWNLLNDRR